MIEFNDYGGRYDRHHLISWWDQTQLARAHVLVAGAGAVGNEVLKNLALLGVGRITVVDFDRIERSNLSRTVLFREGDVGKPKASVAARATAALNNDVQVTAIDGDLEFYVGEGLIADCDLMIGCLDNLHARIVLSELSHRVGTPWLNTGISQTAAEVTRFSGIEGPCFRCLLSEGSLQDVAQRYSCSGLRRDVPERAVPTTTVVASLAGSVAVSEAVLMIHGRSDGLQIGEKLVVSTQPHILSRFRVPRDPDCIHEQPARIHWLPTESLTSKLSVAQILDLASIPRRQVVVELGFSFLEALECSRCGVVEKICEPAKLVSAGRLKCSVCGDQKTVHGISRLEPPHLERTLKEFFKTDYPLFRTRAETGEIRWIGFKSEVCNA